MAFEQLTPEQMSLHAADAEKELNEMPLEQIMPVANWVGKWYLKAGYKRLGRVLVEWSKTKQAGQKKIEERKNG